MRLGLYGRIAAAKFKCAKCGSGNVRFAAGAEELGQAKVDPKMHFAGVYENKLLD